MFRFPVAGTFAGVTPQIATTPRGHGVVIWAVEGLTLGTATSSVLQPDLVAGQGHCGLQVGRDGDRTDLVPARVDHRGVGQGIAGRLEGVSASLTFGGKKLAAKATIDGSKLKAGKVYALVGKVVFTKGGVSSSASATLKFRSCIAP